MGDDGFGGFNDGPMGDLGGEGNDNSGAGIGLGGDEGFSDGPAVVGLEPVEVTGQSVPSQEGFLGDPGLNDLNSIFSEGFGSNTGQTQGQATNTAIPQETFNKRGKNALGFFTNLALNMFAQKAGIPGFAMNAAKNGVQASQSTDPDAAGKAAVNTGLSTTLGLMGPMGMVAGLGIQGLNSLSEMGMIGQPNTNADGSPAPAGTTGASSMGTNGIGGFDMLQGLASLYGYNRANNAANDQINSLSGMYGQDSPYAQMLRQQLQRSDAAGGRRSNMGGREVELQAKLAQMAGGNANAIANIRGGQNQMRAQGLAQILSMLQKSGAMQSMGQGLQGMWNSGVSSGVSDGWLPSTDVGMTDTPFPDAGYTFEG